LRAAGFCLGTNGAVGHSTPEQLLKDALAAHRRGSIGDAKRLYASVLSIDPANAAAYGNLAIIAAQQGDFGAAERLFRQEINLKPDYPTGYNNLGSVLQQQGRPADAIVAHRQAIKLNPNYAEAHNNLGNILHIVGRVEEAIDPKIRDEIFEDAATLGGMGFSAHFGQRDGGWFPVTQFRGRFFAVRAGIFESFRHRYAGGGSSFGFPRARQAPGITAYPEWHHLPA